MNKGAWTSSGHFILGEWADGIRSGLTDLPPASTKDARVNGDPYDFRSQAKYYWWVDARKYNNEEDDDMTQDKFNEMFKVAMGLTARSFGTTTAASGARRPGEYAVSSACLLQQVPHRTAQPNFMWEDLLTREQCAQLFYRFASKNGLV